jgi:hypothetical protein
MRELAKSLGIASLVPAVAAFWLCAAQPAKAGDGADLGSLQTYINDVCTFWGMSTCPQIPTVTQAVLQVAAFVDIAPEAVRSSTAFAIPVGPYVDAGNPSRPPGVGCSPSPCVDPLNPITGLPVDPGVLSSLRPLAFVGASNSSGAATPTQLYNPSANAFLYAVGGTSTAGSSQPDTLVLFYDDPTRTTTFSPGQVAANISLPLTVLNKDGTEYPVPATLQYQVPKTGAAPCSASAVTGNFSGNRTQTLSPAKIGVNCAVVFGASPVSPVPHAIVEVTIPMLITPGNDPAIINGSPLGFGAPFFGGGDFGFAFSSGRSIGIGPNAAPFGPAATTSATYALCASLPTNASGTTLLPSVAAFYSIAGDGEVLLSAPLAPSISIVCPAM